VAWSGGLDGRDDERLGAHDLAAVQVQTLEGVGEPLLRPERLDLVDLLGVGGGDREPAMASWPPPDRAMSVTVRRRRLS
jgi:hypothetical protein